MANKQCPVCKMEQPEENQHCVGCKATFDTSPKGATPKPEPETVTETSDAETSDAKNGDENDDET